MSKISPKSQVGLPREPVAIGTWRLDWGLLRLQASDGTAVKLTPKAGAVLAALLAARGRTVSRAELFEAAWPGSPSSDEVLTQVMQELRRAFADRQREPAWIVTVPKLGYRWEGPAAQTWLENADAIASSAATIGSPAADRDPSRRVVRRAVPIALAVLAAIVATAWLASRPRPAPEVLPIARPLLREPAREFDPDLSRDGERLLYAYDDGAAHELRLRTLADGSERSLLRAADAVLAAPRLSRGGDRVAYVRRTSAHCEVRMLTLASGDDRALPGTCPPSLPTSMDWSADDAWLYVTRSAGGEAVAQRHLAIHRIRLADGTVQRISDAGRWLSVDGHPRLSDDGRTLAFVRDGDGRNRVVTMPADGGSETELDFAHWPYRVAWDGDGFVLAVHGSAGVELWRGTRDGRLQGRLAREGAGPGLAVAAGRIVFERHRADDNLWRLDLRDAAAAPQALSAETGSELAPRLSPDGLRLAYLADAGGDLEVHVRDLAAGTRRALTALAPRVPLDLRWAPDGRRLLLIVGTERGKRLRLLQTDGTPIEVPPALRELVPAQIEWAADGDLYLAAERDGRRELLRARAPDFIRAELVVDGSIVAFALDDEGVLLRRPGSDRFERGDGRTADPATAQAVPADQWTANRDWLVQAVQTGNGEAGRLLVSRRGDDTPRLDLQVRWPEPPLGRHVELRGDTLLFARRDRVETDLYSLDLRGR